MTRLISLILIAAAAGIAAAAYTGTASADPGGSHAFPITLDCGSAGAFEVVPVGNGQWGVAHEVGTNRIFHPTAFGEITGTFTDNEGNTEPFTEPPISKRGPSNGAQVVDCTFHVEFSDEFGTGVVDGSVTAFVVGH